VLVLQFSNIHVFNRQWSVVNAHVYIYMCMLVCLFIVLFRLRPSWKIDLSNEWPLKTISFISYCVRSSCI